MISAFGYGLHLLMGVHFLFRFKTSALRATDSQYKLAAPDGAV